MLTNAEIAQHLGLMTSSVVAACLDKDPYASPFEGWRRIRGEHTQAPEGNPATERGDALERVTLAWGAQQARCEMQPAAFLKHADGWSGDTTDALYVDRETGEVACAEAKTTGLGNADNWGDQYTDQVPEKVLIQCYWHMIHHNLDVCWQPVLVGGYSFRFKMYRIRRNPAYAAWLWGAAKEWFDRHITANVAPPYNDKDTDYLKSVWPRGTEGLLTREQDPERFAAVEQAADQRTLWRERRKLAEKRQGEADNNLRVALQDAMGCHTDHFKVSYRNGEDIEKTDWQAIALELGADAEIITAHTQTKPGPRTLRCTVRKTKDAK